jgi:hypothetical protein
MADRSVEIVYCEDIRLEKSEQFSIIGVYQLALSVPNFPFVLPKICFWVRVRTDIDDLFQSLTFVVDDSGGNQLANIVIPPESLLAQGKTMDAVDWTDMGHPRCEVGIHFGISPLVCSGPMVLRPKVVTERETLTCTPMRIQASAPEV